MVYFCYSLSKSLIFHRNRRFAKFISTIFKNGKNIRYFINSLSYTKYEYHSSIWTTRTRIWCLTYHVVVSSRASHYGRCCRRWSDGPDAVLFLEILDDRTYVVHVHTVFVLQKIWHLHNKQRRKKSLNLSFRIA